MLRSCNHRIVYNHSPITLTSTKLWSKFLYFHMLDRHQYISTIIPVCENSQSLYCCCYGWVSRTLAWCISCPSCGVCRLENSTPGTFWQRLFYIKYICCWARMVYWPDINESWWRRLVTNPCLATVNNEPALCSASSVCLSVRSIEYQAF